MMKRYGFFMVSCVCVVLVFSVSGCKGFSFGRINIFERDQKVSQKSEQKSSSRTTTKPKPPQPIREDLAADHPVVVRPEDAGPATPDARAMASWQESYGSNGEAPRLKAGLLLSVRVFVAGELEIEEPAKRVSGEGNVTMPLIGDIVCSGMTLDDFTRELTTRYKEFLQSPIVDVDFVVGQGPDVISPWGQVTVLGRVKQPGRFNIPPTREMSLSKALQMAGGLDTSAKITSIRLTRRDAAGKARQLDVNFQSVGQQGSLEKDLPLQDGDVIFVPESVF